MSDYEVLESCDTVSVECLLNLINSFMFQPRKLGVIDSLADCRIQNSVHGNEDCRLVILVDFLQSFVKFETCFLLGVHILRINKVQH